MLGRKTYEPDELENARAAVKRQLADWRTASRRTGEAMTGLETTYFNGMLLALDRLFVHRLRSVTGKDGNPVNEVEMLAESLMNNAGRLTAVNVITYAPESSVLGLEIGAEIRLGEDDFDRLSSAFLDDLERRFVG